MKLEQPVRWSAWGAVKELGVPTNKIKRCLRSNSIVPGEDGKFSTRQIFDAMNSLSALEGEAKRARFQAKIDDAEYQRLRLTEPSNPLARRISLNSIMRSGCGFATTGSNFVPR